MRRKFWAIAAAAAIAALASPGVSSAAFTIGFDNVTNESTEANDVANQFFVDVNVDGTKATFTFRNEVGIKSSITDLYFDASKIESIFKTPLALTIEAQSGAKFSPNATPKTFGPKEEVDPEFKTTVQFTADSDPPAAPNGINAAGDSVTVAIQTNSASYDEAYFKNQFISGALRIGLHVQAIGAGNTSDWFVGGPVVNPVPAPAGLVLVAGAVPFLGLIRRRFRKAPTTAV